MKNLLTAYTLVPKESNSWKKMTRLENGPNIDDRASGLGLTEGMDILLSALNHLELIQY